MLIYLCDLIYNNMWKIFKSERKYDYFLGEKKPQQPEQPKVPELTFEEKMV